ncbi:MAG: hypothetical protein M1608_12705 [Candidatus Omnitrophica bacterium]|nr:hypothetical protein [Candidatus Omnitrophota bacterium]
MRSGSRVSGHEGDYVHSGRGAPDEGEQADMVRDGLEDFIALGEVVFHGFENVAHGGGGRVGASLDLERGNAVPNFALVGMVGAGRLEGAVAGLGFTGTWEGSRSFSK